MQNIKLTNQLIVSDMPTAMLDYVSLQPDIDKTKIDAAAIVAQNIDIKRIIGKDNLLRCISPTTDADKELEELITPTLCYFTYARLLKMFQGTFTDSGYIKEGEAIDINMAKSTAAQMSVIAEAYLQEVVDFLKLENPNDGDVSEESINPRIRAFGGKESRGSN